MKTDEQLQKDLNKIGRALKKVMREVGSDGNLYLANNTLNLMRGPHHTGSGEQHQENVIASVTISGMDGGDW